jgi:DNA-binding GntR family transcriptional regulator
MYPMHLPAGFETAPPLTAAERVAQTLRAGIADGSLPMGASIVQDEVAKRLGVSRMPVREALRQLESEGLIVVYANTGAFVSALNASELREVFELRILLETSALRTSLAQHTATLSDAHDALLAMDTEQDTSRWQLLNDRFHEALYAGCGNRRMLALIATLRNQVVSFYHLVNQADAIRAASQQEHHDLFDACRSGDIDAALTLLTEHLRHSTETIIASRERFANTTRLLS